MTKRNLRTKRNKRRNITKAKRNVKRKLSKRVRKNVSKRVRRHRIKGGDPLVITGAIGLGMGAAKAVRRRWRERRSPRVTQSSQLQAAREQRIKENRELCDDIIPDKDYGTGRAYAAFLREEAMTGQPLDK